MKSAIAFLVLTLAFALQTHAQVSPSRINDVIKRLEAISLAGLSNIDQRSLITAISVLEEVGNSKEGQMRTLENQIRALDYQIDDYALDIGSMDDATTSALVAPGAGCEKAGILSQSIFQHKYSLENRMNAQKRKKAELKAQLQELSSQK